LGCSYFSCSNLAGWEFTQSFQANCSCVYLDLDFISFWNNRRNRPFKYFGYCDYCGSSSLCNKRGRKIILRGESDNKVLTKVVEYFGMAERLFWVDESTGTIGVGPTYGEHSFNGLPVNEKGETLVKIQGELFVFKNLTRNSPEVQDKLIGEITEIAGKLHK